MDQIVMQCLSTVQTIQPGAGVQPRKSTPRCLMLRVCCSTAHCTAGLLLWRLQLGSASWIIWTAAVCAGLPSATADVCPLLCTLCDTLLCCGCIGCLMVARDWPCRAGPVRWAVARLLC